MKDDGPLMGGAAPEAPSLVLLIFAIAPCTQAFIWVLPEELAVPL